MSLADQTIPVRCKHGTTTLALAVTKPNSANYWMVELDFAGHVWVHPKKIYYGIFTNDKLFCPTINEIIKEIPWKNILRKDSQIRCKYFPLERRKMSGQMEKVYSNPWWNFLVLDPHKFNLGYYECYKTEV